MGYADQFPGCSTSHFFGLFALADRGSTSLQCSREGFVEKLKEQEGEGCNVYGYLEVRPALGERNASILDIRQPLRLSVSVAAEPLLQSMVRLKLERSRPHEGKLYSPTSSCFLIGDSLIQL